jgi:hypothetical protein
MHAIPLPNGTMLLAEEELADARFSAARSWPRPD